MATVTTLENCEDGDNDCDFVWQQWQYFQLAVIVRKMTMTTTMMILFGNGDWQGWQMASDWVVVFEWQGSCLLREMFLCWKYKYQESKWKLVNGQLSFSDKAVAFLGKCFGFDYDDDCVERRWQQWRGWQDCLGEIFGDGNMIVSKVNGNVTNGQMASDRVVVF